MPGKCSRKDDPLFDVAGYSTVELPSHRSSRSGGARRSLLSPSRPRAEAIPQVRRALPELPKCEAERAPVLHPITCPGRMISGRAV